MSERAQARSALRAEFEERSAEPLLEYRHAAVEPSDLGEADPLPEGARLGVLVSDGEPERLEARADERVLERGGRLLAVSEPLARLAEQEQRDVRDAGLRVMQVEVEDAHGGATDDRDEGVDAPQVVALRVGKEPRRCIPARRATLGPREVVGRSLEAGLDLHGGVVAGADRADARALDRRQLGPGDVRRGR